MGMDFCNVKGMIQEDGILLHSLCWPIMKEADDDDAVDAFMLFEATRTQRSHLAKNLL